MPKDSIVRQQGGAHYQTPVQHWDWAQYIGYLEGCATKYIARHKSKNGLEDIAKGLSFIEKIMARDYPEAKFEWLITVEADGEATPAYVNQD